MLLLVINKTRSTSHASVHALSNTGSVPDAGIIAANARCLNTDSMLAKMHIINVLVCTVKMAEIADVGVIYYARLWFFLCTVSSLSCTDSPLNVCLWVTFFFTLSAYCCQTIGWKQ